MQNQRKPNRPGRAKSAKSSKKQVKFIGPVRGVRLPPQLRRKVQRPRGKSAIQRVAAPAAIANIIRNPTSMPWKTFQHPKFGQGITVSGRMFICNLLDNVAVAKYGAFTTTSASAQIYATTNILLNPNVFNVNLEILSEMFTKFRFTKFVLDVASGQGTNVPGTVMLGYVNDPIYGINTFPDAPGADTLIGQVPKSISAPQWKSFKHALDVNVAEDSWYDVYCPNTFLLMSNADFRQVFQGCILSGISLTNGNTTAAPFSACYADYTAHFAGFGPRDAGSVLSREERRAHMRMHVEKFTAASQQREELGPQVREYMANLPAAPPSVLNSGYNPATIIANSSGTANSLVSPVYIATVGSTVSAAACDPDTYTPEEVHDFTPIPDPVKPQTFVPLRRLAPVDNRAVGRPLSSSAKN